MTYEVFENLPGDRKNKILDASLAEFSKNGYEGASTNEIVKKAGISKGILFHYFGNKKNLYLYVLDHTIDYSLKKFYSDNKEPPADLIDRIIFDAVKKVRIANEDPQVYAMLFNAFINTPESLKKDIELRYQKIYDNEIPKFMQNLDTSKFRSDIDANKAVEVILLMMEGLKSKYSNRFKTNPNEKDNDYLDKVFKEIMEYVDIVKKGIYKQT